MAVNSGDFVQAAGLLNNLVEQANGDLEHLDMSLYISVGKNYDRESGGGAVTLQSKSITKTPTRQQQQQTVYPDPGFDGLSSVGVTVEAIPSEYVIPSGSVTITQNGTVDVSGKAQAIVNVPTGGDEPALQQKAVTVTPTTQQQQQTVAPDSGFDGLSSVGVTVEAIPSEYVVPSGSVTITENGTVDVSGKAQAVVNVPTGGGITIDDIATNAQPSGIITLSDSVTTIGNYAFSGKPITAIYGPEVTAIGVESLNYTRITSITDDNFPKLGANSGWSVLLRLPTTCKSIKLSGSRISLASGSQALRYNTGLISVEFPNAAKSVGASAAGLGAYGFGGCTNLELADCGFIQNISANAFNGATKLTKVILRYTSLVSLANVSAFTNTPFRNSTNGKIYVPSALIESYKTATNWSTLYNAGHCFFEAIEGSEYEL